MSTEFGSIKGLVVDMTGHPVIKAAILFNGTGVDIQDEVIMTDLNGEYVIKNMTAGRYTISVNSPGRVVVSRQVNVIANKEVILDFLLGY